MIKNNKQKDIKYGDRLKEMYENLDEIMSELEDLEFVDTMLYEDITNAREKVFQAMVNLKEFKKRMSMF